MPKRPSSRYSLLALLILIAVFSVRLLGGQTRRSQTATKATPAAKSRSEMDQSGGANNGPVETSLAKAIDDLLNESDAGRARWGVFVMSLKDGRVLYSHDANQLFTPASNMKVYTTAVALDLLGADYRWRTSVYANKQPEAGIIEGDLTLYGRGAPDLITKSNGDAPSLTTLADQVYQAGVREVRGNIIGDNSYFRGELFGEGWQWNDIQWYFGAEPSALSIDENSVEVTIAPAKEGGNASVLVNPNSSPVHLTNTTKTGERDETTSIGIIRDLSSNEVRVWGDFPVNGHAFSAFLSIHDPAAWAANLFRQALVSRGVKVTGYGRSRDFRVDRAGMLDPEKSFEIAHENSEPMAKIVHRTNKESNNLFAELILRTIGKERGSLAPDPDAHKNRERGDDEAGTAVVRSWLESRGITTKGLAIRDGSGLSRLDLITPETTGRLLAAIANTSVATVFHDSLPVAGRDGTLNSRLKRLTGRISAKTGTLTYTHSLSGYATTLVNDTLIFSIMCNDATANDHLALRTIDEIAAAIADFRPAAATK